MRISDWSSDVCSSDLLDQRRVIEVLPALRDHAVPELEIAFEAGQAQPEFVRELERLGHVLALHADAAARREGAVHHAPAVELQDAAVGEAAAQRVPHLAGVDAGVLRQAERFRSEEHTSELQSLMRISYA